LHALQAAITPVSEADRQMMMALGRHFRALWLSNECSMALKKTISRILLREIMVSLDEGTQDLPCMMHWQGGCPPTMSMKKPLSGAIKYKTPEQDIALIRKLSARCDDGEIARVLSKRGRTTARGKRWNQTRVAYTRKQYGIPAADQAHLAPHILSLGQAVKYTGGRETTRMQLMHKAILPCHQVAPYAPLELNKSDLDRDPVRSLLEHLKTTGVLVLAGVSLPRQESLFQ
jgi:hypothetical protein